MSTDYEHKYAVKYNNIPSRKFRRRMWRGALLGLVLILLSNKGVFPKSHTSILCDDPSIRRTFASETIPPSALLAMSSLGAFLNFLLVEWAMPRKAGRELKQALSSAWHLLKDIVFGQFIAYCCIEFFKMTVSEPRPHFIQTCQPNLPEDLCAKGYVELHWYNCTNPYNLSRGKLYDTMKSFPSGHAGLGAFIALYMGWYFMCRLRIQWPRLLGLVLTSAWAMWGILCGLSRVWDNKHHWWDVAVGAAIGVVAAVATIRWLSRQFLQQCRQQSAEWQAEPTTQAMMPAMTQP